MFMPLSSQRDEGEGEGEGVSERGSENIIMRNVMRRNRVLYWQTQLIQQPGDESLPAPAALQLQPASEDGFPSQVVAVSKKWPKHMAPNVRC
jgi:hypothetical protein